MEDLERSRRGRPAKIVALVLFASMSLGLAEPVAVVPRWQVSFPAAANGKAAESTAIPLGGDSLLVAVVMQGTDAYKPALQLGNRPVSSRLAGYDPVSRLGFLRVEGDPKAPEWLEDSSARSGASLSAMTPGGAVTCQTAGWVKQVGGKILPLALLRVNFDQPVPPAGTALVDSTGRVAAVFFQAAGPGNTGYAIPAEAVHRVRRDVCAGGRLVRGWLGLSLRADNPAPQIVRVLPNSPAAAAGIKPADVLLSVGTRQISDYADAANAFFYLIPGQPVRVKLRRGADQLDYDLTPTRPAE